MKTASLAFALLLTGATSGFAQNAADSRWQAWIGCWEAADGDQPDSLQSLLVCLTPSANPSAVDAVTLSGNEVIGRERIEVAGERRNSERDGCVGWEQGEWSPDGMRVYLSSEHMCPRDLTRRSSGLMSISAEGEWLDVRSLSAGGEQGVRVVRYREVWPLPADVPAEIRAALSERPFSASAARMAAGGRLSPEQVIEASRRLDAGVVEAWLVERRQRFALDAKDLADMADAGVPGSVTDLMIALSYPARFGINRSARAAEIRQAERRALDRDDDYDRWRRGRSVFWDPFYFSPFGYRNAWSHYGYGFRYGPFGYYYDRPIIIVNGPQQPDPPHGRVVRGRGYRAGGSSNNSPAPTTQTTSSGSDNNSSGSSSSSSGGGGSSERTAKPRGS